MRHFENPQVQTSTNENDYDLGSAGTGPHLSDILAEKTQRSCETRASLSHHLSHATGRHLLGVQFITSMESI